MFLSISTVRRERESLAFKIFNEFSFEYRYLQMWKIFSIININKNLRHLWGRSTITLIVNMMG